MGNWRKVRAISSPLERKEIKWRARRGGERPNDFSRGSRRSRCKVLPENALQLSRRRNEGRVRRAGATVTDESCRNAVDSRNEGRVRRAGATGVLQALLRSLLVATKEECAAQVQRASVARGAMTAKSQRRKSAPRRSVVAWIESRSSFPMPQMDYAATLRRRTESGRPASSIRLRTATPTAASAC